MPLTTRNERGARVLLTSADGSKAYLTAEGASPQGNRPFVDEWDLATGETRRLFQSDADSYETPLALLDPGGRAAPHPEGNPDDASQLLRPRSRQRRRGERDHRYRPPVSRPSGRGTRTHSLPAERRRRAERPAPHPAGLRPGARRTPAADRLGLSPRVQERRGRRAGAGLAAALQLRQLGLGALLADPGIRGHGERHHPDHRRGRQGAERQLRRAARRERPGSGGRGGPARSRRPGADRDRRALLRRVHDGEPAGALGHLPGGDRPERGVQPQPDPLRLPERAAGPSGRRRRSTSGCPRSCTPTRSTSRSC